ncbi:MAG: hypothetical protein QXL89_07970 [Nitrososphaeria archaeon]
MKEKLAELNYLLKRLRELKKEEKDLEDKIIELCKKYGLSVNLDDYEVLE